MPTGLLLSTSMTSIRSSFSLLDFDFLRVERIRGRGTACPLARGIRDLAILLHSRGDLLLRLFFFRDSAVRLRVPLRQVPTEPPIRSPGRCHTRWEAAPFATILALRPCARNIMRRRGFLDLPVHLLPKLALLVVVKALLDPPLQRLKVVGVVLKVLLIVGGVQDGGGAREAHDAKVLLRHDAHGVEGGDHTVAPVDAHPTVLVLLFPLQVTKHQLRRFLRTRIHPLHRLLIMHRELLLIHLGPPLQVLPQVVNLARHRLPL
mmetsp:Transcript_11245/g.20291  ORF Transcript_11245/g.20291 Transcript_11245/m.20291 type:complete len:262 (-) Transcript_11245:462-1247(-)